MPKRKKQVNFNLDANEVRFYEPERQKSPRVSPMRAPLWPEDPANWPKIGREKLAEQGYRSGFFRRRPVPKVPNGSPSIGQKKGGFGKFLRKFG